MTLIGTLPYYHGGEDLDIYIEQLEQYCEINDIGEVKKKALLLTTIGQNVFQMLRDLCFPESVKNKTFGDLCKLLEKQYIKKKSVFRERYDFYNAKQSEHEKISEWFARLKRLSIDCKFGTKFEEILLDRFITGLKPSATLDRLCEEQEQLTLQRAVEIAINKESAIKGATGNNTGN